MGKDDSPELKKKEEKADRREKYEATKRERARKRRERAACILQHNARIMHFNRQNGKWIALLGMAYRRFVYIAFGLIGTPGSPTPMRVGMLPWTNLTSWLVSGGYLIGGRSSCE